MFQFEWFKKVVMMKLEEMLVAEQRVTYPAIFIHLNEFMARQSGIKFSLLCRSSKKLECFD